MFLDLLKDNYKKNFYNLIMFHFTPILSEIIFYIK
jgi:hypothetical protein